MRLTLLVLLCCSSSAAIAGDVYECTDREGETWFSGQPCHDQAEPITLPEIGALPGMERIPPYRKPAEPEPRSRPEPRGGLTFGERNRLREIEIRLDGLNRDLRGGHGTTTRQEMRAEVRRLEKEQKRLRERADEGYAGP